MRITNYLSLLAICIVSSLSAQRAGYWQQSISYTMNVDMDAKNNQYNGTQEITYTNNSPDTLTKLYFHLYFNAFQPGSMMDVRSRSIVDPDKRVADRINNLTPDQIGYLKVIELQQQGVVCETEEYETILKVKLSEPILPGKTASFSTKFKGQVPLQIRRSGRDNEEGVKFSMTQWYPKVAEYDNDGWHPNPYVGREFYGVWGDFDVTINIDSAYTIGGTGILQNPDEIGHGYSSAKPQTEKLSWNFKAENVHDFAWAADKDYIHDVADGPNGMKIHFFYKNDPEIVGNWKQLPEKTVELFEIMNTTFGEYPYKAYSVIQGGDGGMEYPMATLITGKRKLSSLVGVTVHEVIHSWYQMLLGTNESLYSWMDEGFTTYASNFVMDKLYNKGEVNFMKSAYGGYNYIVENGMQEPLTTHADHYTTNTGYGVSAYTMGSIFLNQLRYILGDDTFYKGMKSYYYAWRYKHPTPNDFIRVMEKESGLELDWYLSYWTQYTKHIDYGIKAVDKAGKQTTEVTLEKLGEMPMTIDVKVTSIEGETLWYHIPVYSSFGHKTEKQGDIEFTIQRPWKWTNSTYTFNIPIKSKEIESIEIDPFGFAADLNPSNNIYPPTTQE